MARSTVGKIKLDIERLEREGVKYARRLDDLKRAAARNAYLLGALRTALVEKLKKEQPEAENKTQTLADLAVDLGKGN